jgi:hypothetical protein
MINSLVYIPSGLQSPELEVLLSKAQEIINSKKNLNIIICSGAKDYACSFNIYSQKTICISCKNRLSNGLKNLKGNYNLLETPKTIKELIFFNEKLYNKIINKKKLLKIYYKKIDVGLASYSSYLSISRDLNLEGFFAFDSLKKILKCTVVLSNFFLSYLKKNNINEIFIFNGRQNQSRPLFRIARTLKIKVTILEHTTIFRNSQGVRDYKDHLPYDYNFFSNQINDHFSKFSSKKKNKYSDNYFKFKQRGAVVNDKVSYIQNQKKDLLPRLWNLKKKNIVFFTSSEDEYEVLGNQYKNLIYENQTNALLRIIKSFVNKANVNYHLWIRMHPNLSNVKWSYNSNILKLRDMYPNIHLIKPSSKVSSYKIINLCDKFLTFSSSTALEAVYMNKPTILLAKTYFDKLKCFYIPKNHQETIKLIFNHKLKPKKREDIKKFALFWIESGKKQKYFSGNFIDGFKFKSKNINYSFIYMIIFYVGKIVTHYFFNWLNFYITTIIRLKKIFKKS